MDKLVYPIQISVNTRDIQADKFDKGILAYACHRLNQFLSVNNQNADDVISIKFNETGESIPGVGEFKHIHLIAFVRVKEDFYDSRMPQE